MHLSLHVTFQDNSNIFQHIIIFRFEFSFSMLHLLSFHDWDLLSRPPTSRPRSNVILNETMVFHCSLKWRSRKQILVFYSFSVSPARLLCRVSLAICPTTAALILSQSIVQRWSAHTRVWNTFGTILVQKTLHLRLKIKSASKNMSGSVERRFLRTVSRVNRVKKPRSLERRLPWCAGDCALYPKQCTRSKTGSFWAQKGSESQPIADNEEPINVDALILILNVEDL